ncbi:hypothetical protein MKX01_008037 [Papaver californicum]|nr:hypothetical protein MKX01_008037 [Papaver californicum]
MVFARPGANILLPRPGFPYYEACAGFRNLEYRHFDLLPEKGWEVDLEAVEALADENTVGMVITNPGNPCGSVYTYEHLKKVAETAKKLGILVIADEVYGHLAFASNPFVPMGSISKRWIVPGWRLGWLVVDSVISCLNISGDPATLIQAAIPQIIEKTTDDFFSKVITILRKSAEIIYDQIKEIDCITCPHKPEGSIFVMVGRCTLIVDDMCFFSKIWDCL